MQEFKTMELLREDGDWSTISWELEEIKLEAVKRAFSRKYLLVCIDKPRYIYL
jgi:hypothetical protein